MPAASRFRLALSRSSSTWLAAGLALALGAAVVWWFFPQVVAAPNDYFLQAGGDAIQGYFATAWYALYDQSGSHFSGMNYPYGEHFNYPNLQPVVAWGLGQAQRLGLPAGQYTVGVINALALAGLALTPLVLLLIMRRLGLPVLYAVFTALCIAFLSPQLARLGPHVSLSYPVFIPLLWYFIIRMQQEPARWRWYVLYAVSSLLMGGVMLYFLATACFFLLGHLALLWWRHPRRRPWLGRMAAAALLPLLLYRGYLFLTDPITDRPPNPYGLFVYLATPGSIFLPNVGPLAELRQQYLSGEFGEFEGQAYIGLVAGAVLLAAGLTVVWRRRGRGPASAKARRRAAPGVLTTALVAAGLLLVLSLGVPFKWAWAAWLTEHSGPVKQFRSLGRFAWPFYYVAGVYAAYWLYRHYRWLRRRSPQWGRLAVPLLALPLLGLWAAEAYFNLEIRGRQLAQMWGADTFTSAAVGLAPALQAAGRFPTDFQTIVPIPYLNNGTDKVLFPGTEGSIYLSEQLALATGVPLFSAYISRASIGQALRHVQIFSSPLLRKEILADLPNDKPLLLLALHGTLPAHEQLLLARARLIAKAPEADLYELPLSALAYSSLAAERARADSLLPHLPARPNGLRCTRPLGVLVESYDRSPDRRGRLSPGARYEPAQQFTMLYEGPVPTPADTGMYEASVWMHGKMDYSYGNLQVKVLRGNEMPVHAVADAHQVTEIEGDWVRVVLPFRVPPGADRLEVLYDNRDLLVDDLIIRPASTDVYYFVGEGPQRVLVKNGYRLGTAAR